MCGHKKAANMVNAPKAAAPPSRPTSNKTPPRAKSGRDPNAPKRPIPALGTKVLLSVKCIKLPKGLNPQLKIQQSGQTIVKSEPMKKQTDPKFPVLGVSIDQLDKKGRLHFVLLNHKGFMGSKKLGETSISFKSLSNMVPFVDYELKLKTEANKPMEKPGQCFFRRVLTKDQNKKYDVELKAYRKRRDAYRKKKAAEKEGKTSPPMETSDPPTAAKPSTQTPVTQAAPAPAPVAAPMVATASAPTESKSRLPREESRNQSEDKSGKMTESAVESVPVMVTPMATVKEAKKTKEKKSPKKKKKKKLKKGQSKKNLVSKSPAFDFDGDGFGGEDPFAAAASTNDTKQAAAPPGGPAATTEPEGIDFSFGAGDVFGAADPSQSQKGLEPPQTSNKESSESRKVNDFGFGDDPFGDSGFGPATTTTDSKANKPIETDAFGDFGDDDPFAAIDTAAESKHDTEVKTAIVVPDSQATSDEAEIDLFQAAIAAPPNIIQTPKDLNTNSKKSVGRMEPIQEVSAGPPGGAEIQVEETKVKKDSIAPVPAMPAIPPPKGPPKPAKKVPEIKIDNDIPSDSTRSPGPPPLLSEMFAGEVGTPTSEIPLEEKAKMDSNMSNPIVVNIIPEEKKGAPVSVAPIVEPEKTIPEEPKMELEAKKKTPPPMPSKPVPSASSGSATGATAVAAFAVGAIGAAGVVAATGSKKDSKTKARMEAMEKDLKTAEKKTAEESEANIALRNELTALDAKYKDSEEARKQYSKKVSTLELELEDTKSQMDALQSRIAALEEEKKAQEFEFEKLEREKASLLAAKSAAAQTNAMKDSENKEAITELRTALEAEQKANIEKLEHKHASELKEKEQEKEVLEAQHKADMEKLEKRHAMQLEAAEKKSAEDLKGIRSQMETSGASMATLQMRLEAAEQCSSTLTETLETEKKKSEKLTIDVAELNEKMAAKESELSTANSRSTALDAEIKKLQDALSAQAIERESESKEAEKAIAATAVLSKKVTEEEKLRKEKEAEIGDLKKQLEDSKATVSLMHGKVSIAGAEEKAKTEAAERKAAALELELDTVKSDLKEAQIEILDLRDTRHDELQEMQNELHEKTEEAEDAQRELDETTKAKEEAERTLANSRKELQEAQMKIKQLSEDLATAKRASSMRKIAGTLDTTVALSASTIAAARKPPTPTIQVIAQPTIAGFTSKSIQSYIDACKQFFQAGLNVAFSLAMIRHEKALQPLMTGSITVYGQVHNALLKILYPSYVKLLKNSVQPEVVRATTAQALAKSAFDFATMEAQFFISLKRGFTKLISTLKKPMPELKANPSATEDVLYKKYGPRFEQQVGIYTAALKNFVVTAATLATAANDAVGKAGGNAGVNAFARFHAQLKKVHLPAFQKMLQQFGTEAKTNRGKPFIEHWNGLAQRFIRIEAQFFEYIIKNLTGVIQNLR